MSNLDDLDHEYRLAQESQTGVSQFWDNRTDHPYVMALHAAISRRDWWAIERAANQIRDDKTIRWPRVRAAQPDKEGS